jgi:S-formylglutathione hydrolase FrmB
MGQQDILEILIEHRGEWLDSNTIADKLINNSGKIAIRNNLKSLSKHNEIEKRKGYKHTFEYRVT